MQLFDQMFDGDTPPQFAANLVFMLIDTQTGSEPIQHLDDLSCPLLGQQAYEAAPDRAKGFPFGRLELDKLLSENLTLVAGGVAQRINQCLQRFKQSGREVRTF